MKQLKSSLFLAGIITITATSLGAETITIPIASQAQELQGVERPARGASKQQIEHKFGKPINWTDPVGKPPITQWEYENFSVFFEYDHVIHSVLKHKTSQ